MFFEHNFFFILQLTIYNVMKNLRAQMEILAARQPPVLGGAVL